MKVVTYIFLILFLSPLVSAVPMDDYEQVTLQEEIRAFPEIIVTECSTLYNEGMVYVKEEVDRRMTVFPTLIAVATAIGASIGAFVGVLFTLMMFKKSIMTMLRTRKDLVNITTAYLKKLEEVTNGRDSREPERKST